MKSHPHLQHPPIIEALLNFEANAAAKWDQNLTLGTVHALFPEHSQAQMMREVSVELRDVEPGPSHKVSIPLRGYMLRSPSQPTVHQVRRDGYAFSRLRPYEDWTAFVAAAREGWEVYRRFFEPEELHRLAVRFINRLEFPIDEFRKDRAGFITIAPQVPTGLDWSFLGFAHSYTYVVPESVCFVNVNMLRQIEPGRAEVSVLILDVEIAMKESLAATGKSQDDLLEEMRFLKNEAFFNILTKQAITPYR